MGPHGLSFNIEQTPTGGVNVTVQQAGGARGEVRVNGVSSEIPATTARAPMGNRGGAAGASRSSASPGTQPDLRQRHLCTVRGCKYVARTKGFVDRKKLVLHVLEKHPGTELASSFRTEGFTKVKGQHKLKKLKKKPEPGAAARKKTKKADTTKKNNKPTRKKSTSAAATPTMRRTPTPRREQEPVTWAHNLFGSPRAAAKAAKADSGSDSDSDSDSSSGSSSSSSDRKKSKKSRKKDKKDKKGKRSKKEKKSKKDAKKHSSDAKKPSVDANPEPMFGARGFIKETDKYEKEGEFRAWLGEVKKLDVESLQKWEEKELFKEYAEDYNTATLPHEKFYHLEKWSREEAARRTREDPTGAKSAAERESFDDETERKREIAAERERREAKYKRDTYIRMKGDSGDLENLREQERLKELRKNAYNMGDTETVARVNKILAPDDPDAR